MSLFQRGPCEYVILGVREGGVCGVRVISDYNRSSCHAFPKLASWYTGDNKPMYMHGNIWSFNAWRVSQRERDSLSLPGWKRGGGKLLEQATSC